MAFDFPAAPTVDQEHTEGGVTYVWTADGVWDIAGGGGLSDKVDRAGDTMTGPLVMAADAAASINLLPGGGQYTGRIEFHDNAGVRRGYLGRLDSLAAAPINLVFEGGTRGLHIAGGGLSWGSDTAVTDLNNFSKGVCLYGYGTTSQFGFNITSGTLNVSVQNVGNQIAFNVGGTKRAHINQNGFYTFGTCGIDIAGTATFRSNVNMLDGKNLDLSNGYYIQKTFGSAQMFFHAGQNSGVFVFHITGFGNAYVIDKVGSVGNSVSGSSFVDRTLLDERPELTEFAEGEDEPELRRRGVSLGRLLLHALDRIKQLECEIAELKGRR